MSTLQLALYQPEIPQNTGTLIRLTACVGVPLQIIEPCGFVWSDRHLKRSGMDYTDLAMIARYQDWDSFQKHQQQEGRRLVLLDTKATTSYVDFSFQLTDTLLVGRESTGVPEVVMDQIAHCVRIPLLPQRRSLNMAIAASMVLGEALRQTDTFPLSTSHCERSEAIQANIRTVLAFPGLLQPQLTRSPAGSSQ